MKIDNLFTPKRMSGLWKSMYQSEVPLVEKKGNLGLKPILEDLTRSIANNNYLPSVPHGYLGMSKGAGVTRFVPVLTREDMLTYYALTLSLQDFLVENLKGVYGAYLVVPKKANKNIANFDMQKDLPIETLDLPIIFEWGSGFNFSLKKSAWIKDWKKYVDFLNEAMNEVPRHYKLITTDIANFYDTINIDKLSEKLSRRLAKMDADERYFDVKDLLITFLRFWDRRLGGYQPSSKGIPQELTSDASRLLANFYLINFDLEFQKYCEENDLRYARWADDIVVFGASESKLELAIHKASKILLKEGLNLNSSKTKLYTKSQFKKFRGFDVIEVLDKNEPKKADRAIKALLAEIDKGKSVRNDTIFKRVISFTRNNINYKFSAAYRKYIEDCFNDYNLVSTLRSNQMRDLVLIHNEPLSAFRKLLKIVVSKPYAAPKASFLKMVWKSKKAFEEAGINNITLKRAIDRIYTASEDSPIIQEFCVPAAKERI